MSDLPPPPDDERFEAFARELEMANDVKVHLNIPIEKDNRVRLDDDDRYVSINVVEANTMLRLFDSNKKSPNDMTRLHIAATHGGVDEKAAKQKRKVAREKQSLQRQLVLWNMLDVHSELPVRPDVRDLCLSYAVKTSTLADAWISELHEEPATHSSVDEHIMPPGGAIVIEEIDHEIAADDKEKIPTARSVERKFTANAVRTQWATDVMWSHRIPSSSSDVAAWKRAIMSTIKCMDRAPHLVSVVRRLLTSAFNILRTNVDYGFFTAIRECLMVGSFTRVRHEWIQSLLAVTSIDRCVADHVPSRCAQTNDVKSLNVLLAAMRTDMMYRDPDQYIPTCSKRELENSWLRQSWKLAWQEYKLSVEHAAESSSVTCMRSLLEFLKTVPPTPDTSSGWKSWTFRIAACADDAKILRLLYEYDFRMAKEEFQKEQGKSLLVQLVGAGHCRSLAALRELYGLTTDNFPDANEFVKFCKNFLNDCGTLLFAQATCDYAGTIRLLHDSFQMKRDQFAQLLGKHAEYRAILIKYGGVEALRTMLQLYGWQHHPAEDFKFLASCLKTKQEDQLARITPTMVFMLEKCTKYASQIDGSLRVIMPLACTRGMIDIVRALAGYAHIFEQSINFRAMADWFMLPAMYGHPEILREFKRSFGTTEALARSYHNHPLQAAIDSGNPEVVRVLRTEYGLNVHDVKRDIDLKYRFQRFAHSAKKFVAMVDELRLFGEEMDSILFQAISYRSQTSRLMQRSRPDLWASWQKLYSSTCASSSSS